MSYTTPEGPRRSDSAYSTWRAPRPDQSGVRPPSHPAIEFAGEMIAPFLIDPAALKGVRPEAIPARAGQEWWYVNASDASAVFASNHDPRKIAPDVLAKMPGKVRDEVTRMANGEVRFGLTTVPREDESLPALFRVQITGTGRGSRDITAFVARKTKEVKTGQTTTTRTVAMLVGFATTGDIEPTLTRLGKPDPGYKRREQASRKQKKQARG